MQTVTGWYVGATARSGRAQADGGTAGMVGESMQLDAGDGKRLAGSEDVCRLVFDCFSLLVWYFYLNYI